MGNVVIVAIPDENDRVWKVSSEKVPHLTILALGDQSQISNLDKINQFVEHATNTTLNRFYLTVDRRGELGADQADVLFFKKGYDYKAIRDFRAVLLKDNNIKTAYDSAEQFEGPWEPHLTLGYPETPAKPENDDFGGFYSVGFNKIAVWTGDYEGPEFLLKDYWDEMELLETVPMDVAMSVISTDEARVAAGVQTLEHFGVKGMKWGVRKEQIKTGAKTVSRVVKDSNFEDRTVHETKKRDLEIEIATKAQDAFEKESLPAINAKPEYVKASKLKNRLLHPADPMTRQYRAEARKAYIEHLEKTANSMTNASGTRQYTIRERGIDLPAQGGDLPKSRVFWNVSSRDIQHAAGDPVEISLEVIMDEDGFITGLKPAEDAMAQTADMGSEFLAHYGVKGMHWGVRKEAPTAVAPTAVSRVPQGEKRKTKIETSGGENHPAHQDAIKVAQARTKLAKSGPAALSNAELRDVANRIQLEQQVKQLTAPAGKRFVKRFLGQQGQQSAARVITRKAVARGF